MRDFGDWFRDSALEVSKKVAPEIVPQAAELVLPENVYEMKDGTFTCDCCCCGRACEVDPEWFTGNNSTDWFDHYCGGSERCCP